MKTLHRTAALLTVFLSGGCLIVPIPPPDYVNKEALEAFFETPRTRAEVNQFLRQGDAQVSLVWDQAGTSIYKWRNTGGQVIVVFLSPMGPGGGPVPLDNDKLLRIQFNDEGVVDSYEIFTCGMCEFTADEIAQIAQGIEPDGSVPEESE